MNIANIDHNITTTLFDLSQSSNFLISISKSSDYIIPVILILVIAFIGIKIYKSNCLEKSLITKLALAPILSIATTELLKLIIKRPRPFIDLDLTPIISASGYSFPSTHSAIFASLTIVAFSINKRLGYLVMMFAIAGSLSRVFAGVHFLSDVIIGFILGSVVSIYTIKTINALSSCQVRNK